MNNFKFSFYNFDFTKKQGYYLYNSKKNLRRKMYTQLKIYTLLRIFFYLRKNNIYLMRFSNLI